MFRKITLWAVIGSFLVFFSLLFGGLTYLLLFGGLNLPTNYLVGILVGFFVFLLFGLFMMVRAARMLSGDGTRVSEYFRSTNKSSVPLYDVKPTEAVEESETEGDEEDTED